MFMLIKNLAKVLGIIIGDFILSINMNNDKNIKVKISKLNNPPHWWIDTQSFIQKEKNEYFN